MSIVLVREFRALRVAGRVTFGFCERKVAILVGLWRAPSRDYAIVPPVHPDSVRGPDDMRKQRPRACLAVYVRIKGFARIIKG